MRRLSRTEARRIAVSAQLLDRPRPTELLTVVDHLTLLQLDPTAAVAPTADLVCWSRLGSAYAPADLVAALDRRELVELAALVRPAEDMVLFRAQMAAWRSGAAIAEWRARRNDWVAANDRCRRDILERLTVDGPLTSRDLPGTCVVPWKSSGWTHNRNLTQMLESMAMRGEVAIAGRQRRERLWDLAERIYPDDPVVPPEEAVRRRGARRLRALGLARARAAEAFIEPTHVGESGDEVEVDGVKGTWRVDPTYLDQPFAGRTALLSPFDRLIHDRQRALELFEFDYTLEMYKPAAQRRWGYYALPILRGDRLIGKLDAAADRKAGVLRVNAIHEDVPFSAAAAADVDREIADLARWLGLTVAA